MENKPPFQRVRELEAQLRNLLSHIDTDSLPAHERELAAIIKRQVGDARLDLRDYGMADSLVEQKRFAHEAEERLEQLQKQIVHASEYNLFGAADVAQFSAHIQQIISDIQ